MIIKLIAETDAEKKSMKDKFGSEKIVHTHVKEYFIFGNKNGADNKLFDFHEWNGSYRYLISSLKYFSEIINDERRSNESNNQTPLNVSQFMQDANKAIDVDVEDEMEAEAEENEEIKTAATDVNIKINKDTFVKRGAVVEQNVEQIDVETIKFPHVIQMNNDFEDASIVIPKPPQTFSPNK